MNIFMRRDEIEYICWQGGMQRGCAEIWRRCSSLKELKTDILEIWGQIKPRPWMMRMGV
jgi:hypothetical protein